MCGLAGFLGAPHLQNRAEVLVRMGQAIAHRGPDSAGQWLDEPSGIGLSHRRLSIVDLSEAGAQPMVSSSGRWVVVFNGEIYNHLELREELENAGFAPHWRGHSDTETLLAGFDAWGVQRTIEKCIGMFAFAVWCKQTHTLTLGRDRLGEKPLYYGWQGTGSQAVFLFASELKALRQYPGFRADIDRDALVTYMHRGAVSGTHCIYAGISKVPPATLVSVSLRSPTPTLQGYWSAADVAARGIAHAFPGTEAEAIDALESVLSRAVRRQLMADVPLGAFLSGGVDSSAIVALMQAQSSRPIRTFTVGSSDAAYDEAHYAKAVARHLGTDHTELYVNPAQTLDVIPRLPFLYDEPFADASQIPTYLICALTRRHVKVALSGDGGDELFGGYNRYHLTASSWEQLSRIPSPLRRAIAWGLTRISPATLDALLRHTNIHQRWNNVGEKLHKGASVMSSKSVDELYRAIVSVGWPDAEQVVLGSSETPSHAALLSAPAAGLSNVQRMMATDLVSYLPDDILTKIDRAAMGVSLETRVPYLDHQVVEFAWSLPLRLKLRDGGNGYTTKWALREVLYRHVPRSLIERPKMGFGIPLEHWLRGPLRDWAEELLAETRIRSEGFFDVQSIRRKWAEHLSGRRNWQHPLWCVLMFNTWFSAQLSGAAT